MHSNNINETDIQIKKYSIIIIFFSLGITKNQLQRKKSTLLPQFNQIVI